MDSIERAFLDDSTRLDAEIAAAGNDPALLKALGRKRMAMLQDYAKKLIELGHPQLFDSYLSHFDFEEEPHYEIFPVWIVSGVPSKAGRPLAEAWMRERGKSWNGEIKDLREEVEDALLQGKSIPRFGLSIGLTVVRKGDRVNHSTNEALTDNPFSAKLAEFGDLLEQAITDKWPGERKFR
jgi:hypothetical protein